ncbi:unnamed protein product [Protopolystoma xenopodis]|uniref:Uncharacterized protein n=1 Tax=Protopolystoma xenopodis TaxID=117903 RepID=A0A448X5L9_9PLAT|nr:unnamed protein product [Protopolystoma xenopodis]
MVQYYVCHVGQNAKCTTSGTERSHLPTLTPTLPRELSPQPGEWEKSMGRHEPMGEHELEANGQRNRRMNELTCGPPVAREKASCVLTHSREKSKTTSYGAYM